MHPPKKSWLLHFNYSKTMDNFHKVCSSLANEPLYTFVIDPILIKLMLNKTNTCKQTEKFCIYVILDSIDSIVVL